MKKMLFDRLLKVHKSRKMSWFEGHFHRLNLEGGNVACDRIVEDNIVDGDILAGEEFNGLVGRTPAQEGGHRVELRPPVPAHLMHMLVLK
jgi:hypothetical protein